MVMESVQILRYPEALALHSFEFKVRKSQVACRVGGFHRARSGLRPHMLTPAYATWMGFRIVLSVVIDRTLKYPDVALIDPFAGILTGR